MRIVERQFPAAARDALVATGIHPVIARLLAARGVSSAAETDPDLRHLLAPAGLMGIDAATRLLADAVLARHRLLVVADYDCDGATACAVAIRGLRAMGAEVDYIVPNRFEHGYGLTPAIVELAARHPRLGCPHMLITVDNGIASVDGVARARELGIDVLVTDHHLPGDQLPAAAAIVNPNQPGCTFASRNLAGVGVAFYLLLALRAELRRRGAFAGGGEPALQSLLELVALGTVADLVRLDRNNRLLVAAGLRRIRQGLACEGVRALFAASGRDARVASCTDLGFALGPRINAAGRMTDIGVGIECLLADSPETATELAGRLDSLNRERREVEAGMREQALADLGAPDAARRTIVAHREGWHEGVIGLVASRLKDRHHRPTVAFARSTADPALLRGSGRSIAGVHLRDILDLVSKRHAGLIERFGGHAMAAGLTLRAQALEIFTEAFEQAVTETADPACFETTIQTDGALGAHEIELRLVDEIDRTVWGQGFPQPLFSDDVEVLRQRLVKDRHTKLELKVRGRPVSGIVFGRVEPLPPRARVAYRLARNDWNGVGEVQLIVEAVDEG